MMHKRSGYLVYPRPLPTAVRTRTMSDLVSLIGIPIINEVLSNFSQCSGGFHMEREVMV